MSRPVEYLVGDALSLADRLVGPALIVRDPGLLRSAVARPQTSVGGSDAYPDIWTKAAALLQSIVNNHALIDGNERPGWVATAVFLEINEVPIVHATNDDVDELAMDLASSHVELSVITQRLRAMVS